jgi:LacI family transcriptional regulator
LTADRLAEALQQLPFNQDNGGEAMAGVKDVAAHAGVSLGTVSNVLNQPHRVSPATRRKVEEAMVELGFVRNEAARHLRSGRSRTLAYVMLDAANPFFTDVAAGIEETAESGRFSLYMCNSDNRVDREVAYLDHLVEQRVQGILVTPIDPEAAHLAAVAHRGTPVVVVDRTPREQALCSVAVDDVLGGRLAVEHLLDRGHERIAFVGGPESIGQVRDRLVGARGGLDDAGAPPVTVIATEATTVREGRTAGERILGLPRAKRPTAAFCANDLLALGLLQQLVGSGLAVPDDLAIVGYDDIYFAGAAAVPLTSVRQPRHELGRRAAQLVLDEADNPEHSHQQVVLLPELVARTSTLG